MGLRTQYVPPHNHLEIQYPERSIGEVRVYRHLRRSWVSGMMHVMNAQVFTSVDIVLPEYPAYIPMHLQCNNVLGCMTFE